MIIIGLQGSIGSGKTTFANMIRKRIEESTILPFAGPLKRMAYQIGWDGQKDEKGRRLLQLLGTEIGRECIDEDIWVNHWKQDVEMWLRKSKYLETEAVHCIIADDMRFMNEYEAVTDYDNHLTIKLYGRDGYESDSQKDHASEFGLPDQLFDECFLNDGQINDLEDFATEVVIKAQRIALGCGNI